MSVFAIGDLHLSMGADKPMDIFGPAWEHHTERLEEAWRAAVAPEDTVVLAGDTSWGISLAESLPDFAFLESLPGKKILIKGNHDYYWDTMRKMDRFLEEHGIRSIRFLRNDFVAAEGVALCGAKGWFPDEDAAGHDRKIYLREVGRLRTSLQKAADAGFARRIVFLHYPPVMPGVSYPEIIEALREFGVEECFYGHLHGAGLAAAVQGERDGVRYRCISGDHIRFVPQKIL